jgi:diguanylate cyclase (GGDEF)-like protein
MSNTVIDNITMERLHEIVKTTPNGIFITNIESVGDTYTITLSDSCNVEVLQDMAFKDYLSGIYNRRYFVEQLDIRIAEFERKADTFGVVMLDIDEFTNVNNTYGHEVGDIVIQQTAQALEQSFKRKSDIVARLGGDEFVVLISGISDTANLEEMCAATCEKLMERLSVPINIDDTTINITGSVGVAFTETNDQQIPSHEFAKVMLRRADQAMYKAKENGKNTYSIYSKNNKNNKEGETDVYKTNGGDR